MERSGIVLHVRRTSLGGMCEPWYATYLIGRTLLLVLAVWLGLGGELAQTAKSPLHYAVPGGGRTYDQSLPPKV